MSKCISYSLFGYGRGRAENCFDFDSYMRGLFINLRLNRLIYPDWVNVIHMDMATYNGFHELFDRLSKINDGKYVKLSIQNDAPLTLAMLWRLRPVFNPEYTHVICRDLDSPTTYREAQCVQYWIEKDKAAHAITDSISHNIPMLGGMIGFRPAYFSHKTGAWDWEELMRGKDYPWDVKGTDQEFLNRHIYPRFAQPGSDSITQHYLKGHGNTFLSDYHNTVPDIPIGVSEEMKESNDVCGHIGAAGFYEPPMIKFLAKHRETFNEIREVEALRKDIFYWNV